MPKKKVALSSLADIYRIALKACVALWPLFLIRIVFLFLNLIFFALCLVAGFVPVIKFFMSHLGDLNGADFKDLLGSVNILDWFGYPQICIVAFYVTCSVFFGAFFYGAIYSQLIRHQKNGEDFSVEKFLMDGLKKTLPMMGLIWTWILMGLVVFGMGAVLAVFAGVLVGKLFPWWFDVLLLLPTGLFFVLILSAYSTAISLSAAFLADGHEIWNSIGNGTFTALRRKGRAIGAMLLLWVIYLLFLIAFTVVFGALMLLPKIGIFFGIIKFFVTMILAVGFNIYMASLGVALALEPKSSH